MAISFSQAFCVKFSRFKDQFDNLTLRHKNRFDIENILNQAETQYSSLKKHNLWTYTTTAMRPTDNSNQVLTALTAQLKEMEKKVKSLEDTKSTLFILLQAIPCGHPTNLHPIFLVVVGPPGSKLVEHS